MGSSSSANSASFRAEIGSRLIINMASTTLDLSRDLFGGETGDLVSTRGGRVAARERSFFFQTVECDREEKHRTDSERPKKDVGIQSCLSFLKMSILWNDFRSSLSATYIQSMSRMIAEFVYTQCLVISTQAM